MKLNLWVILHICFFTADRFQLTISENAELSSNVISTLEQDGPKFVKIHLYPSRRISSEDLPPVLRNHIPVGD